MMMELPHAAIKLHLFSLSCEVEPLSDVMSVMFLRSVLASPRVFSSDRRFPLEFVYGGLWFRLVTLFWCESCVFAVSYLTSNAGRSRSSVTLPKVKVQMDEVTSALRFMYALFLHPEGSGNVTTVRLFSPLSLPRPPCPS